jgi:hypothetical protein
MKEAGQQLAAGQIPRSPVQDDRLIVWNLRAV